MLATNVAETSLTVPGIRYVIDPGTARISRYSHRTKVQRLPIEPISQASRQPAQGPLRPRRRRHLHPAVLRGGLRVPPRVHRPGDPAHQPGVGHPADDRARPGRHRRPSRSSTRRTGAASTTASTCCTSSARSTPTAGGRRASGSPRSGASSPSCRSTRGWAAWCSRPTGNGCVREVMVIAAALSIQDPRERPAEQAAGRGRPAHARFADRDLGLPRPTSTCGTTCRSSSRSSPRQPFRRLCQAEFLNYLRVREWQDLYAPAAPGRQERSGVTLEREPADAGPERIHTALLAGLLSPHRRSNDGAKREYLGARGARFAIFPGSALFKKPPRWVMAAELVETTRLWARVSRARSSRSGSSRWPRTWSSAATASRTGRRSRAR